MGLKWSPKSADQFLQAFDFAGALSEKEAVYRQEIMNILRRFLEVKDSLEALLAEQATETNSANPDSVKILHQIEVLDRQLMLAFQRSGVTAIECVGQEADSNLHHVVAVVEHPDAEPHIIVEERLRGYTYQDELLRRPEVVVVKDLDHCSDISKS